MNSKGENSDARTLKTEETKVNPDLTTPIPVVRQSGELTDAELGAVAGGTDQNMKLLTSLQQQQHDTAKSVIQNIRA